MWLDAVQELGDPLAHGTVRRPGDDLARGGEDAKHERALGIPVVGDALVRPKR